MIFASVAEFGAVETQDRDGKDKLQKAQGQVGDNEWQRLAARDSGGGFLVEARKCHCESSSLGLDVGRKRICLECRRRFSLTLCITVGTRYLGVYTRTFCRKGRSRATLM